MADRPDQLPEWATEDQIDDVSGQNNVVEPPSERKESGWDRREIPPRQWQNWLARLYYRWIEWARDKIDNIDSRVTTNEGDIDSVEAELDAATNEETPDTLAKRDADGRIRAEDPEAAQDVATKKWTEDQLAGPDDLPVFFVRAWGSFDEDGNILGSGNVSSVTRNGTGDYSVVFSEDMPDSNYSVVCVSEEHLGSDNHAVIKDGSISASGFDVLISNTSQGSDERQDAPVFFQIVR